MSCCVHQLVAKFVCLQFDGGRGFLGAGRWAGGPRGGGLTFFH